MKNDKHERVAPLYDFRSLAPAERSRAQQLEDLYGFAFPAEVLEFWRWYQELAPALREVFREPLGIGLVGPFDVLAGEFDGRELEYPGVLHYRFREDPPEFVTLFGGQQGERIGLWFDDHRRLSPVVVGYYRDDFYFQVYGDTLFAALACIVDSCEEGLDNDPYYREEGRAERQALAELKACLPAGQPRAPRPPAIETDEGMGVIVPEVGGKRAEQLLLRGRHMWAEDPRAAGPVLEEAYRLADRPELARIVATHMRYPLLPQVSVCEIEPGSYFSLEQAQAEAARVRVLALVESELTELPDLSAMTGLEDLQLYGNQLRDLPASLRACRRLKKINLFRNPMTRVPEVLFSLPALEQVLLAADIPDADRQRLMRAFPGAEVR